MKTYLGKGSRFGKLTVIGLHHKEHIIKKNSKNNYYKYFYLCKCDCGKETICEERSLKSGNTKSCGCYNISKIIERNTTHNLSSTRLYKIYHGMKKRCYNHKSKSYKNYGGRGIKICKEWLDSFPKFYEWSLNNGYREDLTIERKDVNGNYEPQNCCWVSVKEQAKNRRRNVFYELNGVRKILPDWAREYNMPFTCVRKRLIRGWSLEKALKTPKLRRL